MKKSKLGFTLIEVALFLVITTALFAGVIAGMYGSVTRQEKNDAVQNFFEFLRTLYSEVSNVQNAAGGGRTEKAIYGKLITFNEGFDFKGNENRGSETTRPIYVYTVIGKADKVGSGDTLQLLSDLKASVVEEKNGKLQLVGISEEYRMRWESRLQPACKYDESSGVGRLNCDGTYRNFEGSILILRHPNTGNVYTYFAKGKTIEVNERIKTFNSSAPGMVSANPFSSNAPNYLRDAGFEMEQIDFCVNVSDTATGTERRNVRINKGASNASGVELLSEEATGAEGQLCVAK